jgi:NADH dehydrogenase
MQQGITAANNILHAIDGRELKPFRYRDRGILATIGRSAAAAQILGRAITGLIAWIVWLVVHIGTLIGFRNRLQVLVNWAYHYIRYDPAARLIVWVRQECEFDNESE